MTMPDRSRRIPMRPRPDAALQLPAAEVTWSGGAAASRGSNRNPRSAGVTSSRWEVLHKPTGVYVRGEVPPGHYSRTEMARLRAALWRVVWRRLAQEVAIHTRMPRRPASEMDPDDGGFRVEVGRY